jgi:hypothetical protein
MSQVAGGGKVEDEDCCWAVVQYLRSTCLTPFRVMGANLRALVFYPSNVISRGIPE